MDYKQYLTYTINQLKEFNNDYMVECKALLEEIETIKLTEPQAFFLAHIQNYFMNCIKPYLKPTDPTKEELAEINYIFNDYRDKLTDFLQDIKRKV